MDRPDPEVAQDDLWRRPGKGYDGHPIRAIVTDDAEDADRAEKYAAEERRTFQDAQRKVDEDARRKKQVRHFIELQLERVERFPTQAQPSWPYPAFRELDPDHVQRDFESRYFQRLTADEITATIRQMLDRWVVRIVGTLPRLKPLEMIWLPLTGGHLEAAQQLKDAPKDHPDLKAPFQNTIDKYEPEQSPPKPKPTPSSPGFSGPSM
ncbi:hypothetical protein [Palleronia caenipelagi]|uniref:Uncharacterized protein n=1 Tax=Palleronia caenipelagi TaxID=2489174 RepID=A0A547PMI9_9RHOB|nr:hypothetical protein [Palleronia caenipelagi]TRD15234.1 hypothetical protein FEV53_17350 [Palleronia caenipelagi]